MILDVRWHFVVLGVLMGCLVLVVDFCYMDLGVTGILYLGIGLVFAVAGLICKEGQLR